MPYRQVPAERSIDADILAALHGLCPVRSDDAIELMPRQRVMDLIDEHRKAGKAEAVKTLLEAMGFDGEEVFRKSYSQMASCKLSVRTSTMYRLLERMSRTGESREDILRRLLTPAIDEVLAAVAETGDAGMVSLLRHTLDGWGRKQYGREDASKRDQGSCRESGGSMLHTCLEGDSLPSDLNKTSRYFLKNLFRLNNLHDNDRFHHPPEVVEDYWEVISPDQGIFDIKMVPARRELAMGLYRTCHSFGLNRTDNEDYYNLLEFLASERRDPRIYGCSVDLHGPTRQDEVYLQEALSIESELFEDPLSEGSLAGRPRPLSPEGLRAFRSSLRRMSGVRATMRFPENLADPEQGREDFSVLGFDLTYEPGSERFLIDEVPVSPGTLDDLALVIGDKLLALSRRLCPRPSPFSEPDLSAMEAEVHVLIARSEEREPSEELARRIVAKITVLDFYESLVRYAFALSNQLIGHLQGDQVIVLTIPRVLLALLNEELDRRSADELLLSGLSQEGDG